MVQSLARAEIEAALQEMGEILARERRTGEIAVFGGSAILLQFDVAFRTGDVDVVVESGDHGAIERAARAVADRRGWLRSWFSEAVANYVGEGGPTRFFASYPSETRPALRVYVARPDYLLAMKLRAMRIGTRDEADAALLAGACGVRTAAALLALLGQYFPKEPPSPRQVATVTAFAAGLDDAPAAS